MIFTLIVLNFVTWTQKVDVDEFEDKRNAKFNDLRESRMTMSSLEFWILSMTMKIQYVMKLQPLQRRRRISTSRQLKQPYVKLRADGE